MLLLDKHNSSFKAQEEIIVVEKGAYKNIPVHAL